MNISNVRIYKTFTALVEHEGYTYKFFREQEDSSVFFSIIRGDGVVLLSENPIFKEIKSVIERMFFEEE